MRTDETLQHDVLDELRWDPSVNAAAVGITVEDSVVTLSGHVADYSQKQAAVRAAKRIYGIKAFVDNIEVRLPGLSERTDADIARAAANVLDWNAAVPRDHVRVTVRNGWVTLEGEVQWHHHRTAAERAVEHLLGVKGISNAIAVKPHATPTEIASHLDAALRRNAHLDARTIRGETHGHKVILRGNVRSYFEREEAERVAWSAPGVSHVENHLLVTSESGAASRP
jgi:osmotically-inducible protein OsmY